MTKAKRIILASTSPFRKKLLQDAGIEFDCVAAQGDELTITGLAPRLLAAKRAEFKALDVARRLPPEHLIIGADQVLGMEGISFDKAKTRQEAFDRLKSLQGRTHFLHSAICLIVNGPSGEHRIVHGEVIDIPMTMKPLDDKQIQLYVDSGEWEGCVGCYRIEGLGRALFTTIGADESAIIGLPMASLLASITHVTRTDRGSS